MNEFDQINASDERLQDELRKLVQFAIWEDLQDGVDLTTLALVPEGISGRAQIVARQPGTACGIELIETMIRESESSLCCKSLVADGETFSKMQTLCELSGTVRDLLSLERTILNFLGRLCGIATLTQRFVNELNGCKARVYDTRKTTPGWRYLEKYAVHCGGGRNHRLGLYDAVLIKDNHLAFELDADGQRLSPSAAVQKARSFLAAWPERRKTNTIIEIEVDNLQQLADALTASPDIVLLDNMSLDDLKQAVQMRDAKAASVQLEASGGVSLVTIRNIAMTGVDRISVGALTHSATNLDLGLDWLDSTNRS